MLRLATLLGISVLASSAAIAAPPSDCARRFVGTWHHPGFGGGNIETLTADGTAACSGNSFCQQGTWTCQGNVATYTNSAGTWNYTLISPNQMVLAGTGTVVDRIGAAPAPAPTGSPHVEHADAAHTPSGRNWLVAARAAEQYCTYADQMTAAGDYLKAAEQFEAEGDMRRKAQAERSSRLASARADDCDKAKHGPVAARPGRGGSPPPPPPNCQAFQGQADKLAGRGVTEAQMKPLFKQATAQGCAITYNSPASNPLGSLTE